LADLLQYRLPGKEIQFKKGIFYPCALEDINSGFVVADFQGKQWFAFEEKSFDHFLFHEGNFDVPIVTGKDEYFSKCKKVIDYLNDSDLEKLVLSRVKKVNVEKLDLNNYFIRLCQNYPNAFVYLISSFEFGTWIGATPEILIDVDNGLASSMSLAGTKKNNDHSNWTKKEKEEQGLVTDYLAEIISYYDKNFTFEGPNEKNAGPVKHLVTHFSFYLGFDQLKAFVKQVHPTPAVCGLPKTKAFNLMTDIENHKRDLYSGIIGFIGEQASHLYVNLRCSRLIKNDMYIYVGGGITSDSVIEDEWHETENKSQTLIKHL
jgi:isochorismate synthase